MTLMRWIVGAAPFLAMISVQVLQTGVTVVTKAAMTQGMSNFVFVVYSDLVASIILLPLAIIRRKGNPISLSLLYKIFLCSVVGSMAQLCSFAGLKYSSPTLSSAITNLIPLFTYVLAIMMRMEKLDLRSSAGLAITLGSAASVLGASVATLYQGPAILMSSDPSDFHDLHSQQSNWAFGGFLLAITSVLVSVWYIIMAKLVTELPEKDTIVFFYILFCTIITGVFSLFMETNPNAWKLRADIMLIAILSSGIIGQAVRNVVCAWYLKKKGVADTVMFIPLSIVLSLVMAVLFLGETLHTGSLLGGIIVMVGFYTVMWGKGKERGTTLNTGVNVPEELHSEKAPLLLNNHPDNV